MAKMTRRQWQEQTAAKLAAAQETLEAEVAAIVSGEDWKRFLGFQAKLHTYSPNNVLLIWRQHLQAYAEGRVASPEPTYVAGFATWRALGRQVERGQHGYAVLAPIRRVERVAADPGGNMRPLRSGERVGEGEVEQSRQVIAGWKVEHVFEAAMTSGEALPAPPAPRLLEGESPAGLAESVIELLGERGFMVGTVPDKSHIGGANGRTDFDQRSVLIRADMDDAAMCKTLLHEAGHVLLHGNGAGVLLPRYRKEVEAESVAFVVAAAHGMETGPEYSFPYVAAWAAGAGHDPVREVAATQARVAQAARSLLEVSPAEHTSGGRVPGVQAAVTAARQARDAARRQTETRSVAGRPEVGVGVAG